MCRSRCWIVAGIALAARAFFSAPPAAGQVVDGNGFITDLSWLALGPFSEPFGCSGNSADILCNHIGPSSLQCQYPEEGDEVDYDPAQACTTGYVGPSSGGGKPLWRAYGDGNAGCDFDLDADAGSPAGDDTDVVTFLATYFENSSGGPIDVEICGNSDDGLQVWLDEIIVINDNACRGRGDCNVAACNALATVSVDSGVHRIMMGVWENDGGWGGSLALRVDGLPITEGGDFVFYGKDNPGLHPGCIQTPARAVSPSPDPSTCPPGQQEPIIVKVTQSGGVATQTVQVTEIVQAAVTPSMISSVSNGGTVTALAQGPLAPVGVFADHQNIVVNPRCIPENGSTFHAGGQYTLSCTGEDIWQAGDTLQFAYSKVRGDFDVRARIVDRTPAVGSRWGKHGIMARQDLTPRSRYSMTQDAIGDITTDPDNNDDSTRHASRPTHGGSDNFEATAFATDPGGDTYDDYCDGNGPDNGASCAAGCPATRAAGCVVHDDYVRLVRTGNFFQSYSSPDGVTWTFLGQHDWGKTAPQDVYVGLAATSHTTDCASQIAVSFDSVDLGGATILPVTERPPVGVQVAWNVQRSVLQGAGVSFRVNVDEGLLQFSGDVDGMLTFGPGSTLLLPSAQDLGPFDMGDSEDDLAHGHNVGLSCTETTIVQPSPGAIAITGAGFDIWGTADQFMYAYSSVTGDFTVEVDIVDRQMGSNNWAKHGIMVRENCSAGARYFYCADQQAAPTVADYLAYATDAQWRDAQGAASSYNGSVLPAGTHANRLKVERLGNLFIAYAFDEDGSLGSPGGPGTYRELDRRDWSEFGDPAPAAVQVGLAVTSHDGCNPVTVTFENYDVTPGASPQPPTSAVCSEGAQGGVNVTWEVLGLPSGSQTVTVNGEEVATVAAGATSFTVGAAQVPDGVSQVCISNDLGATCCGYLNGDQLHINCGGLKLDPADPVNPIDIGDGRVWEEDTTVNPSPFLVSPNSFTADFAGAVPPVQWAPANTTLVEPEFTDDPARSWLFATERYDDADIKYRVPLPRGTYDVTLLFAEGCCGEGCTDVADPQTGGSPCRVFDVLVNGNLVADQFAQHVEAQKALGNALPNSNWGVALAKGPYTVENTNAIEITIHDLGAGDNPQNAAIKGIAIVSAGGPVRPKFYRADPNNDGAANITDGIYILNFLFLGGPPPTCRESADPNNDGAINITDGIYVLNYLFLGGPAPASPGPPGKGDPCGSDTDAPGSPRDLGCETYTKCP